jgi:CPA2 family monovalent cation:H+ antiporter-2
VVVGLALGFELLPAAIAQFMLIVVGATVLLTPLVARHARIAGDWLLARTGTAIDETVGLAADISGHVIIVGYGRTGQLLASLLDRQQIPHVALDLDADRVTELQAAGVPIQLGDASRAAMLEKVHLRYAAALAICTDDPGATERVLATARRVSADTPIVARARDTAHATILFGLGADRVVPELLASGLQLGHVMLEAIGFPTAAAHELIEAQRVAVEHGAAASAAQRPR